MAEQVRRTAARSGDGQERTDATANPKTVEKGKQLKEDMDKLVDEIDAVLVKNAGEFVRAYVQRGGE